MAGWVEVSKTIRGAITVGSLSYIFKLYIFPVRYSYSADFELPLDDITGAQDLYGGPRRKPLSPLKLETCGGDLTISETATTSRLENYYALV